MTSQPPRSAGSHVRFSCGMILSAILATVAWADNIRSLEDALDALQGPVTVALRDGRTFIGEIAGVTSGHLALFAHDGDGRVEWTFRQGDVERIHFPGAECMPLAIDHADAGRTAPALRIVDALFQQRGSVLAFNHQADLEYLAQTLHLYRTAGRTEEGLARAERILPHLQNPFFRRMVESERLVGAVILGLTEQSFQLATAWVEKECDDPSSALPWCILAQRAIASGDHEAAYFRLMPPIVFSGDRSIEYLATAYELAIRLAEQLGMPEAAEHLRDEREWRGILFDGDWHPFPSPLVSNSQSSL